MDQSAWISHLLFSSYYLSRWSLYLFTWRQDQDKSAQFFVAIIYSKEVSVTNLFGLGALLSHQVIYWSWFAGFILVYIIWLYAWKWVRLAKIQSDLAYGDFTLANVLFIRLPGEFGRFAFPFGGAIGEWVTYYLHNMIGMVGLFGLLILVAGRNISCGIIILICRSWKYLLFSLPVKIDL